MLMVVKMHVLYTKRQEHRIFNTSDSATAMQNAGVKDDAITRLGRNPISIVRKSVCMTKKRHKTCQEVPRRISFFASFLSSR